MDRRRILKEISDCSSFIAAVRVAAHHFKYLKSGSARKVFEYSDTLVLKIAYNKKGVAQNREEVRVWDWADSKQRKILSPIIDADNDWKWVLQKKVRPLKSISKLVKETLQTKKEILDSLETIELRQGDHHRSLGILNSKRIVLFDYGFTDEVYRKYYQRW